MPYIKNTKSIRMRLTQIVHSFILNTNAMITGNLNYFLFKLAKDTCHNYSDYAKFIGELECAKNEIERRLLNPYEDKKIEENGDI